MIPFKFVLQHLDGVTCDFARIRLTIEMVKLMFGLVFIK